MIRNANRGQPRVGIQRIQPRPRKISTRMIERLLLPTRFKTRTDQMRMLRHRRGSMHSPIINYKRVALIGALVGIPIGALIFGFLYGGVMGILLGSAIGGINGAVLPPILVKFFKDDY